MTVSPTTPRPSHHLSLTDGSNTVNLLLCDSQGNVDPKGWRKSNNPRTALRVAQASSGYGDLELPFSSIVQSDFSGGRGNRDFETDSTRYADGYRINASRANELRCGPLAVNGSGYNVEYTTGAKTGVITGVGCISTWTPASTLSNIRNLSITGIFFDVNGQNLAYTTWSLTIYRKSPSTLMASASIYIPPSECINGSTFNFEFAFPAVTFSAGVQYEISVYGTIVNPYNEVQWPLANATGESSREYLLGNQNTSNKTLQFTIQDTSRGRSLQFQYRGAAMAVTQSDDIATPRLWQNGLRGLERITATDKGVMNTSLNLTGYTLGGCIAQIVAGTGYSEEQNWRIISANSTTGTNDTITVSPPWNITHDNTTEFVIIGLDSWIEITGHGLTQPVTDVLVVNDIIYFAQGENTNIRDGRFNSGSWAWQDDGTNKATFLTIVQDENGKRKVWYAQAGACTVCEASVVSWPTALDFTTDNTPLVCGDTSSRITLIRGLKISSSGPMVPVVQKETGFGSVGGSMKNKIYDEYRTYKEARDILNGRSMLQHDVYVFFGLLDGLERHYDGHLDDLGPNRDEGLPVSRKGRVSDMVEYFSRVIVAVDGGRYGYSSILEYNSLGWHELYRSGYGRRIRSLSVQPIPDLNQPARLWFSEEEDIYRLCLALNPAKCSNYQYFSGSQIETSWIYGNYRDLSKYWDNVTLFTEGLGATCTVGVEYQLDNSTTWTSMGTINTSPVGTLAFSASKNVVGKRVKIRLTLNTSDVSQTPVVTALRVDAVVRVKPKGVWTINARIEDGRMPDLNQDLAMVSVSAQVGQLEAWQDGTLYPAPLLARFYHPIADNKYVFLDGLSHQPIDAVITSDGKLLTDMVSFTLMEV